MNIHSELYYSKMRMESSNNNLRSLNYPSWSQYSHVLCTLLPTIPYNEAIHREILKLTAEHISNFTKNLLSLTTEPGVSQNRYVYAWAELLSSHRPSRTKTECSRRSRDYNELLWDYVMQKSSCCLTDLFNLIKPNSNKADTGGCTV
jgi:hypothetical protein